MDILDRLGVKFNPDNRTIITREKLEYIMKHAGLGSLFPDEKEVIDGYLLIEKNGRNFFPFPSDQLSEWEEDGSCQSGDRLYKIMHIKTYK